ncbi:MAG: DNA repair protein RecO [Clostridia bacterium]|nr:DNA repair protein RecO [Clostridia bacterium]
MDPIKTMGIVARARSVGENDMMLTVISENLGRISVWAKGIKSLKHKAHASAAHLCYSEFIIKPKGDIYVLSEAALSESFYGLRNSLESLSEAVYFAALAEAVSAEGIEAKDVIKLLLNSLHYLEHGKKDFFDIRLMYEIKILEISGFLPDMGSCAKCGSENTAYFDGAAGEMLCENCGRQGASGVSEDCAKLMKMYSSSQLKDALNFRGARDAATEGICVLQRFLAEHIGAVKERNYLNNIIGM